jgi:murein DD-endopeptidase MepM/ murein hydrolase activator NlpD
VCLELGTAPVLEPDEFVLPRRPRTGALLAIGLGLSTLSPCAHSSSPLRPPRPIARPVASSSPVAEAPLYGPALPTEEEAAAAFAAQLAPDKWVHPLPGPRRMPRRDSRVFGAERPGDRPIECRSGHCGVDIGGDRWGEPVVAVADGVVARVNSDPNRSGGKYVRIAHRDGAVTTHYFHLAAIPPHLTDGTRVRAGQLIGLVGDTGVDESGPHLHFAISVRPTPLATEHYIDPEPLIALWPVMVPSGIGFATAALEPGVPIGANGRLRVAARDRRQAHGGTRPRRPATRAVSPEPASAAEVAGPIAPPPGGAAQPAAVAEPARP